MWLVRLLILAPLPLALALILLRIGPALAKHSATYKSFLFNPQLFSALAAAEFRTLISCSVATFGVFFKIARASVYF